MIVVSDTSPILNLARIGRLELLSQLYGTVVIPQAVYKELGSSTNDQLPGIELAAQPWLLVAAAKDQARVRLLRGQLDPGEAEAIILAIEYRAGLLLMDERRGRRTATGLGLTVTGLLGVVAKAKQAGLIDLAKPVVDDLIRIARLWIGPELYAAVLAELGEG